MKSHDSRKMYAELVHSSPNNIILDRGVVSGQ